MQKYSIILPVYNGGAYVKECVNSILAQTLDNFNLIVLDNNSKDGTLEWIRSLNDERIVLHANSATVSIEKNWERVAGVKKNEFITLIGHDDILFPDYLSKIDTLIAYYPDASLYQTHFTYIDATGNKIRSCKPMEEQQDPAQMVENFMNNRIDIMGTGFMMRSKDYEEIGGIQPYPSLLFADFELWIELARKNYLAVSKDECFSFRIHQSTTTSSSDSKMQQAFSVFIAYLEKLKNSNTEIARVIRKNAIAILDFYAQGLTSRVLRTPMANRNGQTVDKIIKDFKEYATRLEADREYKPLENRTVRLACIIDRNYVIRNLFLIFKKLHPKPIVKNK